MITQFTEHFEGVVFVTFSPDSALIASAGSDNTVRVWNPRTGEQLQLFSFRPTIKNYQDEYRFTIESSLMMTFCPDVQTLLSVNDYHAIASLDINSGQITRKSYGHASRRKVMALNNKSNLVASHLPIVNSQNLSESFNLLRKKAPLEMANFLIEQGGFGIWNLEEERSIAQFSGTGTPGAVDISSSGQFLVCSSVLNNQIYRWNINTKKLEHVFPNCPNSRAIKISPSEDIVAVGCGQKVKLWNLNTGEQVSTLSEHSHYIVSLDFAPNGRILASGGADEIIKLWDIETGKVLEHFSSPQLNMIAISPNGRLLASAGMDETVRIWEMPSS